MNLNSKNITTNPPSWTFLYDGIRRIYLTQVNVSNDTEWTQDAASLLPNLRNDDYK